MSVWIYGDEDESSPIVVWGVLFPYDLALKNTLWSRSDELEDAFLKEIKTCWISNCWTSLIPLKYGWHKKGISKEVVLDIH